MAKTPVITNLVKEAIKDVVGQALKARPVTLHLDSIHPDKEIVYQIGAELYSYEAAIDKLLGQYSWYNN